MGSRSFTFFLAWIVLAFISSNINYLYPPSRQYGKTVPQINVASFFNGHVVGKGMIASWTGKMTSSADISIHGSFESDQGTIKQVVAVDGENYDPINWIYHRDGPHIFSCQSDEVIDMAKGEQYGNMAVFSYKEIKKINGKYIYFVVDSNIYLLDSDSAILKVKVKRYGFTVRTGVFMLNKEKVLSDEVQ